MLEDRQFKTDMRILLILAIMLGGCQSHKSNLLFLDTPFEGYYEPSPTYWFTDYPWESIKRQPKVLEG